MVFTSPGRIEDALMSVLERLDRGGKKGLGYLSSMGSVTLKH